MKPQYIVGMKRLLALSKTLRYEGYQHLSWRQLLAMNRLLSSEKLVKHEGRYVVNSFLPPFPSPAFAGLASKVAQLRDAQQSTKLITPVSAYFAITDACRYNCPHCSKVGRKGKALTVDVWKRILREAQDLGVAILGFTGGEPLLCERLEELIASVDERSVTFLFTAGDGLTEDRARALKAAGLFGAAVSLDSFDADEHDRGRGIKGAFKTALKAIDCLQRAGLYTMTQIVATKERCTPSWMQRYLDFTKALGVHEVRLLEPMPCGRLLGEDAWRISTQQHDWLKSIHCTSNHTPSATKVSSFAFIEDADRYGCGAGFQHFYVDMLGNLQPCDFTPISFGNLQQTSLSHALTEMQQTLRRPRGKCLMLAQGSELAKCPCEETPIPASVATPYINFADTGKLPKFYRILGWKE